VRVWDTVTGQEHLNLKGHMGRVTSVAFSPDGSRVSAEDTLGIWKTWDTATGGELQPLPVPAANNRQILVSPDRRFRAIADGDVVHLVDTQPSDERRAELQAFWRDDPAWHEEQFLQAEAARDWFAAAFHVQRLLILKPDDPALAARLGWLHAEDGRWPEAVADFTRLALRDPDWGDLVALARAQLGAGHDADYQATVRRLGERTNRRAASAAVGVALGRTPADGLGLSLAARLLARPLPPPNNDSTLVAELGVARPDALPAAELLAWAERAGTSWRGPALVRLKRFDQAAQAMSGWEKWPADRAYWQQFVALMEQGRGNVGKARQAYNQASAWLDTPSKEDPKQTNFARLEWGLRVEIDVLRREVEQLLGEVREPGKLDPVRDILPKP
jgi:tetratricopeptide (TPR) repeat protein